MQKKFDAETGKFTWLITEWWQKTIYVIGWIYVILFLAGFIVGFVSTL